MTSSPAGTRKRAWRQVVDDSVSVLTVHLMFLLLYFHVRYGLLVGVLGLGTRLLVGKALIGALILADVALVVAPDRALGVVRAGQRAVGHVLAWIVTFPLMTVLFVVTAPLARHHGRRALRRNHPYLLPWVSNQPWRGASTWQAKSVETYTAAGRGWSVYQRVLRRVGAGGGRFYLLLALLILLFASFAFLLNAPQFAPFIYTLF